MATQAVGKLVAHMRDHGVAGTAHKLVERFGAYVYMDESHVWYDLCMDAPPSRPQLQDGLKVTRGDHGDVQLLAGLPTLVSLVEAERRLAAGAQLWLVKDAGRAAFACWIFTDFAPIVAAPGGRMRLPPGTAMLEDSATGEGYRGRGIAPAAWVLIAEELERRGYARMLTKVEVENAPSRRAVAKAGFAEAAIVRLRRVATRKQVRVQELGSPDLAGVLRERLRGKPANGRHR
jgi:RimJ/RimL family protein N-acetyltransferase